MVSMLVMMLAGFCFGGENLLNKFYLFWVFPLPAENTKWWNQFSLRNTQPGGEWMQLVLHVGKRFGDS